MTATFALIPAAGRGERFRRPYNKVLADLAGRPLLHHTLSAFERAPEVTDVLVMTDAASLEAVRRLVSEGGHRKVAEVILGGDTRQASVRAGLLRVPEDCDLVAVHDAARCLVTPEVIRRCVLSARKHGSGVAAVPVVDTLKAVDERGWAARTVPRDGVWAVQTPQVFRKDLLLDAHEAALRDGFLGTDEASLVERLGVPVRLVEGAPRNLKITRPEDVDLAEALLRHGSGDGALPETRRRAGEGVEALDLRVGFGYDIHRLAPGRRLVLCGVEIPHDLGLLGHSDADVALHALMDALLGASGGPDIGHLFPNTDPRYAGASSLDLLRVVCGRLREGGWQVRNADITLLAERPKIAPHIPEMRRALCPVLGLEEDRLAIKATTHEGVGSLGRGEAIVAQAVASIARSV